MNFQYGIKGNRKDKPEFSTSTLTKEVGISKITNTSRYLMKDFVNTEFESGLRRTSPGIDDNIIRPWLHPGVEQCKLPYWGKWGQHIKDNLENNTMYASSQCGISGSVYFQLFSYLFSHTTDVIDDPKKDFQNLILLSIVTLVGDGGHNIMEVVYGYTVAIILLWNVLDFIRQDLKSLFSKHNSFKENIDDMDGPNSPKNLTGTYILELLYTLIVQIQKKNQGYYAVEEEYTYIKLEKKILDDNYYNWDVFKLFLRNFLNWEKFIDIAYDLTKEFNPSGVSGKDIDDFNPLIIPNWDSDKELRDMLYLYFTYMKVNGESYDNAPTQWNDELQIMLAMENKRYRGGKKNWERSPTSLVKKILKDYPEGKEALRLISKELTRQFKSCGEKNFKPNEVPFSFPKKK